MEYFDHLRTDIDFEHDSIFRQNNRQNKVAKRRAPPATYFRYSYLDDPLLASFLLIFAISE